MIQKRNVFNGVLIDTKTITYIKPKVFLPFSNKYDRKSRHRSKRESQKNKQKTVRKTHKIINTY